MRLLVGITVAAAILAGYSSPSTGKPVAREVEVIGSDYALTMPHELAAGPTSFHFRNNGKVYHEMVIFVLKPEVTIDQFVRAAAEQKPLPPLTEARIGLLVAAPGKRSTTTLTTELLPGRQYLIWCGFRDTATAPRHIAMGMYTPLSVRPSRAKAAQAKVRADTIVAMDYAFRYPRTLAPGHHTIVLRNDGKVAHEVNIILPKKGVTFEQMFAVRLALGNARVLNDDQPGVLFAPAGESSLGQLDVNLLAGREYRIICSFRDSANAPPHFSMGMYGSIQVPAKPGS